MRRPIGPGSQETSGPPRRESRTVERIRDGATTWDSILSYRGELVYPIVFTEGGREYPGQRLVTFGAYPYVTPWQGALAVVDNADRTVEVRGLDGVLQRSIRFSLPLRPVTTSMHDSVLARDARSLERSNMPPAMKARYLQESREQRFADSVAPYDRILASGDGRLWLRLNETPVDSATTWYALKADGALERRLLLPHGWLLFDSSGERIVIRRLDDDGLGYLELRPMRRLADSTSGH